MLQTVQIVGFFSKVDIEKVFVDKTVFNVQLLCMAAYEDTHRAQQKAVSNMVFNNQN